MKTDLQNYQFFGFSRALSYLPIGLWPPLSSSLSYHGRWFKENHPILCSTYTIGYFTEPIQLDSMLKGKPITVLRQFGDETTWNCRIPQHYIAHFWPICISPRLLRLWRVASTAARSSDNRLKQPAMRRNSATRTMSSYGSTNKHLLGMHTHTYIYIHT